MEFKTALIDADIMVYRVGFSAETEPEGIARARMDELFDRIMQGTKAEKALVFLNAEDQSNFRFALFPEYKANRKGKPKPKHYHYLRDYLKDRYLATEVFDQETDDALGLAMMTEENPIVCTIDKDLDMVPGWHFNFVKDLIYRMDSLECWRSFYHQCLEGDKNVDNIEGCPSIGKIKAARMLEGCENEKEMFETVLAAYETHANPGAHERLWLAGQLLWIRGPLGMEWHLCGSPVSKETLQHYWKNTE